MKAQRIILIVFLIFSLSGFTKLYCDDQAKLDLIEKNKVENQKCLKCHGQNKFFYMNEELGREIKESMCPDKIIESDDYYIGNHRTFKCTDCHSEDYGEFPHNGELRMEEKYTCLDCHGDDPTWAAYKFEMIDEEFSKSVHSANHDETFSCWMCHNPHSYRISDRDVDKMNEIISYDNMICLSCHADIEKYQLITDKKNPNIIEKHDWLPNQALHFAHVRCIECHAILNDSILVSHNVQSKVNAVKNCVECHSSDSRLMASLYKHTAKTERTENGFLNAALMNEAYVIGANRNEILNKLSLFIFFITIAALMFHGILRIVFLRK